MSEIAISTEEEFDGLVSRIKHEGGKAVVLFTAPAWCIPCRRFEPHWKKIAEHYEGTDTHFVTVNMGEQPEDTGKHWATARYSILGVPSVRYFDKGEESVDIVARTAIPFIKELDAYDRRI